MKRKLMIVLSLLCILLCVGVIGVGNCALCGLLIVGVIGLTVCRVYGLIVGVIRLTVCGGAVLPVAAAQKEGRARE